MCVVGVQIFPHTVQAENSEKDVSRLLLHSHETGPLKAILAIFARHIYTSIQSEGIDPFTQGAN